LIYVIHPAQQYRYLECYVQGGMTMKTPASIPGKLLFILFLPLFIVSLTTGCSSESESDGEAIVQSGTVPNLLNYNISQETGVLMTLSQNPSATMTSAALTGSYDRITETFTLNAQPTAVMVVSASEFLSSLDNAFSDYQLRVTTTATWVGDGIPTAGAFEIISGDQLQTITVNVNSSQTGVDISLSPGGDPDSLTWEEFDSAFDNTQLPAYQQIAAFAYGFLRVVYEQSGLVIQALEFLSENDVILETSGSIVETCDTFPFPADDPTVTNPGTSMVSWTDVDNDQGISSGDRVFVDFVDCWDDDPTDTIDTLLNGGIKFENYIEVLSGDVITRVGFDFVGGDHGFDFLRITETDTQPDVVVIEPDTISLTGGFSMVFTAP
jgi:hypothetical protein